MNQYPKIQIVVEKRSDAIGIYNTVLIQRLKSTKQNIDVISFDNTPFKNPYLNRIVEIVNTMRLIRKIRHDEIVVFTDPLPISILASLFLKNRVYTFFFHYQNLPAYYKFLPFISFKKVLNNFDGIITSSMFSQSQLQMLGVDITNSKVIYCGIDLVTFKSSRVKPYPFDYILAVGSEEPRKNMENIIAAFQLVKKDFPQLKLLKVGKANHKNRKQTMNYIAKYGLEESVIFIDYVNKKQLPSVYSNAKLLIFPSLLEGFGLPIVEAMACGCPVVTSNRNPMLELAGSNQVTVNPLDPKAIAEACKAILHDEKYRLELVETGLERAKDFDSKQTAEQIYKYVTSSR